MDNLLDNISRILATSMPRRKALRYIGSALAGAIVAGFGSLSVAAAGSKRNDGHGSGHGHDDDHGHGHDKDHGHGHGHGDDDHDDHDDDDDDHDDDDDDDDEKACTKAEKKRGGRGCGRKCCPPGTCCAKHGRTTNCCQRGQCTCNNGTCSSSRTGNCPHGCKRCH